MSLIFSNCATYTNNAFCKSNEIPCAQRKFLSKKKNIAGKQEKQNSISIQMKNNMFE